VKFGKAQEHIITNLIDVVKNMRDTLADADKVFRDTFVPNVEAVIDLIPKLNIAGDPAINDLAAMRPSYAHLTIQTETGPCPR
jgi:hypothetical protein